MNKAIIFIPYSLSYIIVNNEYIYIYNEKISFLLNIKNNNFLLNEDTNTLTVILNNNYSNLFNEELNKFFSTLDHYFFSKITFVGKGFKWKKKKNNLFLFFNRAHKCFYINRNSIILRLSKNKIILIKNNIFSLGMDEILIKNIRNTNIFTKRGIRCSRQLILKKRGKTGIK